MTPPLRRRRRRELPILLALVVLVGGACADGSAEVARPPAATTTAAVATTTPPEPTTAPPLEATPDLPAGSDAEEQAGAENPVPSGSGGAARPAPRAAAGKRQPTGRIEIPSIGLSHVTYEGIDLATINHGPSHWPGTAQPGERGNTVFPGHRTTYSRPFWDIDKLAPGHEVIFTTPAGRFTYQVTQTLVVGAKDTWIVDPTDDATFTIFACHPKGSARQRYVAKGRLTSAPAPSPPPPSDGGGPDPTPAPTTTTTQPPPPPSGGLVPGLTD